MGHNIGAVPLNFAPMANKRLTLRANPEPFSMLLAITAPMPPHRFCHFLNRRWGTDFELTTLNAYRPKSTISARPGHIHLDEDQETEWLVMPNKHGGEWLLPELKGIDYLMAARPEPSRKFYTAWQHDLRTWAHIGAAYILTAETLQNLSVE